VSFDHILPTFIAESEELLEAMERGLLELESSGASNDAVNGIFRVAHTIKGSAGLFGLNHVVRFTHIVENVLDRVRSGRLQLESTLVRLLLKCCDHIRLLIAEVSSGNMNEEPALEQQGEPLLVELSRFLEAAAAAAPVTASSPLPAAAQPAASAVAPSSPATAAAAEEWRIVFDQAPNVLRGGQCPLSLIRYLADIGEVIAVQTTLEALPEAEELDPEQCYLGFDIRLKANTQKQALESVFEFVLDEARLRIHPPPQLQAQWIRQLEALSTDLPLGQMLRQCEVLTQHELDTALALQASYGGSRPLGTLLVEQGWLDARVVEAALRRQIAQNGGKPRAPAGTPERQSIRVEALKLDHMIDLVGELITAAAAASVSARKAGNTELQECTAHLNQLVEEVRESALKLRMVKIGVTFDRFRRVVHDVAHELGKDIELEISGQDTELDKTVIEKIGDPLTHLVRNAIDHGIESADKRLAAGKPARGTLRLNAFHDSGSIIIEVSDDGGGMRRDRILAKAIERGLIEHGRSLDDDEIFALVFEPGFSTAEQVTNLSGRGVGMDVVKRNITALRGSIAIRSQEGQGSTISVRLPLTLAIINGFLVGVEDAAFVVPLEMVDECVGLHAERDASYINLRGQVLPLIRLRELFSLPGRPRHRESVVVVRTGARRIGLIVDELLGELQTVIKPLGVMFRSLKGISGSTVLGNGDVALILDVPALAQYAMQTQQPARRPQDVAVQAEALGSA
jgi:two-component system chemotaxis sensor kinase CheA